MLSNKLDKSVRLGSLLLLVMLAGYIADNNEQPILSNVNFWVIGGVFAVSISQSILAGIRWSAFTGRVMSLTTLIEALKFNASCYIANFLPLPGAMLLRTANLKFSLKQKKSAAKGFWYTGVNTVVCLIPMILLAIATHEPFLALLLLFLFLSGLLCSVTIARKIEITLPISVSQIALEALNVIIQSIKFTILLFAIGHNLSESYVMSLLASSAGIVVAVSSFLPGGGLGAQELASYALAEQILGQHASSLVLILVISRLVTIATNIFIILLPGTSQH